MANPNYDALLATTLANFRNKLTDNVFSARPFQYWLLEKGRRREVNGGHKIVEQLIYGMNSTAASYSGYDPIALTPQDGISAAEFPWRQYAASIAISGLEEAQNNGEEELIDLLEAKIMQAEETMKEKFDQMFFGDGTGNSGKDWLGLAALVGDQTDSVTTVGNISATSNAYWRSYKDSSAGALTLGQLSTAFNSCSVGNDQPDLALTTQTLYEKYEGLLQPNQRFTDPKTAQAGFQNLLYKGAVTMFDAAYCPTGTWFFLNSKYLKLVTHKAKWMEQTPFVRPENMDARYALILCYGNLTISNRKRQGKLTAKTA
jgi:hypothetical protein